MSAIAACKVRKVEGRGADLFDGLCGLLIATVDGGASIGFLSPMQRSAAEQYWNGIFAELGPGRWLWIAEEGGRIVGSVQLSPCLKENGLHRAELQKLFVLPAMRGRGLATQLMNEAESFARISGLRLLVLDTEVASAAEKVYQGLGWTRYGEVPDYALTPEGVPHATACYYKQL